MSAILWFCSRLCFRKGVLATTLNAHHEVSIETFTQALDTNRSRIPL